MKKNIAFQLLITVCCWFVCSEPLQAQFSGGAEALSESRVIHRAWHITNLRGSNFILKVEGSGLQATDNTISDASTFILEPGLDDANWATPDSRWFHIRNMSTGEYISVASGGGLPRSVSMTTYESQSHEQQFRLIATGIASQYKLRCRLSASGTDLVLETNNAGVLQAGSPKVDPSSEQKFTFNLAMPVGSGRRYILCSPGGRFMSDNGIKAEGTQAVQNKDVDESAIWELEHVEASFYRIRNNLTQLYLTAPSESSAGDIPIMTTSPQGTRSEWEFDPTDVFFHLKSREFPNLFISATDQASGQALKLRTTADSFRKWLVSEVQVELETVPGNYERIESGILPSGCFLSYGTEFKKALCERVGLNPVQSELYFNFIRAAIASKMGQGRVDEILQKMDLNNTGHRVDLALMVRYYVTEVLPFVPFSQWTPAEQAAVGELEVKIRQIRMDYAVRLSNAWNAYVQQQGSNLSLADIYFFWLNGDGFEWPLYYDASEAEALLIADYVSGAATFGERNNGIVGATAIGASVATLSIVAAKLPFMTLYFAYAYNAPLSFTGIAGGTSVGSYVVMAGGPVVAVAVFAASFIAMQATEVAELQQFENSINEELAWAQPLINLQGILSGNNLLKRIKLLTDLDIVLGAPAQGTFQHNTNDNSYLAPFTLSCITNLTLEMDATGHAMLTPNQVINSPGAPLCGSDISYSLSQNQFNCNDIPSAQVTLTAQNDASTQTCTFTVILRDNTPPTITCPATQTLVLGANCTALLPDYRYLATSLSDNCDVDVATQLPAGGTVVSGYGDMDVTITVRDVSGNSTQCTFTVSKMDNTPPTIICPAAQTLVLGANCSALLPDYRGIASTSDACGAVNMTQLAAPGFTVSGAGTMTVLLLATDMSNNSAQCSFTVNKVDQTPPSITCPAAQTLVLGSGCTATLPDYSLLATNISDNCGVATVTQLPAPGTGVSNAGNMTVTLTATDFNGKFTPCTFSVTKLDNTPPSLVCQGGTVQLQGTQYTLSPGDVLNLAASMDNCGQIQVSSISPAQVGCNHIGQTIQVQVNATDGNGNSANCTASVLIEKDSALPQGWAAGNIGTAAMGSSSYDYCENPGEFTLNAKGYTTNTADVQHSVYQNLCGNGEIIARITSISTEGGWAGIQMRESTSYGSKKFTIKTQLNNLLRRELRNATFGATNTQQMAVSPTHTWLRITRAGNIFTAYSSPDGLTWAFRGSATIVMSNCLYAGVFVESINNTTTTEATFDHVSISGGNMQLVAAPVDVPNVTEIQEEVNVFPNPTSGKVNIEMAAYVGRAVRLEIYSMQGQWIQSTTLKEPQGVEELDCSTFQSGMYLLCLKSEGWADVTKLIVVR